ncbi:hypothetical protein Nwi_3005 [Nitrobacter winogradskyi Nb-255]|uniref:Uncharacterized protein n=1 Tax=Nitrobacter winogradskyi (strain ATCC 25391 / DSM 10237 / CIP 104748 / NCIMB 11846 / Nb-255) TaxID=323098 RepID=Q3SN86_NITWN|nr:hypothetical protein Nwi_3005 [Nitrobacter winogradskyi Nb-255]
MRIELDAREKKSSGVHARRAQPIASATARRRAADIRLPRKANLGHGPIKMNRIMLKNIIVRSHFLAASRSSRFAGKCSNPSRSRSVR